MKAIKIQITKFIDDHQPGFIECRFYDAFGVEHIVHEKIPVITEEDIGSLSVYPRRGVIGCVVIGQSDSINGKKVFRITISQPWGVETIQGLTEFEIFEDQIVNVA